MDLIRLFKEYGEKQETLLRLREDEALLALTNTEQHVVAAVGDLNAPNVTSIAEEMGLTKGAVSKNIKKLLSQGYVEAFQKEGNSKNIYYHLTGKGQEIYEKHREAHQAWVRSDEAFFASMDPEEREAAERFLNKYLRYMDEEIRRKEERYGESRDKGNL